MNRDAGRLGYKSWVRVDSERHNSTPVSSFICMLSVSPSLPSYCLPHFHTPNHALRSELCYVRVIPGELVALTFVVV